MKYRVYEEKKEEKAEKEIFFRLVPLRPNGIELIACDAIGERLERGSILYIERSWGWISLYPSVSREIGLCLDESNRVVVENNT